MLCPHCGDTLRERFTADHPNGLYSCYNFNFNGATAWRCVYFAHEFDLSALNIVSAIHKAAQQSVQSGEAVRCQVVGCMHNGVYSLCADHANPPRR